MDITTSRRFATHPAWCALVVLATMLFLNNFPVQAQTPTPTPAPPQFRLDHFLCYLVQPPQFAGPPGISVIDQFNIKPLPIAVSGRDSLCNPVSKNEEPVPNKASHLLGYRLRLPQRPPLNIRVIVSNQFGEKQQLTVLQPIKLLVPTGKAELANPEKPPEPPPIPPEFDHYFCYTVKQAEPFKPRAVTLQDQFGQSKAEAIDLALLCNPAEKRIAGKPTGHMFNNRDHLACYTIRPVEFKPRRVLIHNQFEKRQIVEAARPSLLCVPSLKQREK